MAKKRVIKDFNALTEEIVHQVKLKYPTGYAESLVSYLDREGKKVSALPFETDDTYYLIRMTVQEAKKLVKDDEDFEDEGSGPSLRPDFAEVEVDEEFDGEGEDDDISDGGSDEDDHIIVTRRRDDDSDDIPDDSEY